MLSSKKRIIVASSALSMGVDFPDIRHVVNWGPARNLLDQLQEAGHAGCDGKLSHVITIYHEPGHDCCLHCSQECCCVDCGNGAAFKYPFEDKLPEHGCDQTLSRPVSDEDRKDLQAALQKFHWDKGIIQTGMLLVLQIISHWSLLMILLIVVKTCSQYKILLRVIFQCIQLHIA
ncbi:Hypothetical predicted protein [Paramuricea clavata]|uniref:DNA 3'-5' helicase n=1 Tax=Paramuricea clavata TaxID=317549 RepID=A0A6S7I4R0_PARCT|nr:Hypothetical predicted protein [Paramuricea clavata]